MIKSVAGTPNIEIIKCFRLGKTTQTKQRPIRVILSSPADALKVISKYKPTDGIYINKDLTKLQQGKAYMIRREFKTRIANGEKDIKLKYNNGIPKIITLRKN